MPVWNKENIPVGSICQYLLCAWILLAAVVSEQSRVRTRSRRHVDISVQRCTIGSWKADELRAYGLSLSCWFCTRCGC